MGSSHPISQDQPVKQQMVSIVVSMHIIWKRWWIAGPVDAHRTPRDQTTTTMADYGLSLRELVFLTEYH